MAVHLKFNHVIYKCFEYRAVKNDEAKRKYSCSGIFGGLLSPFLDDATRIDESKAMRRLALKTQVVSMPNSPHVRTRATHTLEVRACAIKIAQLLGLNVDLCSAAALGHDIGHAPFGHAGEEFLSKVLGKKFRHNIFSVVVAEQIERSGNGLNLTGQVLRAIKNHSRGSADTVSSGLVFEDDVVMLADKIAYTWSDINDIFFRLRLLDIREYPELEILMLWFGNNQRQRMETSIIGVCSESFEAGKISFVNSEAGEKFNSVKRIMYERGIYNDSNFKKAMDLLSVVYDFLLNNPLLGTVHPAVALALMTDVDVFRLWNKRDSLSERDLLGTSVWEIIPKLQGKKIEWSTQSSV